jgi:hypothetical protein
MPVSIDGRGKGVISPFVAVVLHEDQVPDFDETAAGVAGKDFVLMARLGRAGTHVVVNFGARAAGAGVAHLPEIVLLVQAEDAFLRHARDLLPEALGFVVLAENRDVEAILGQAVVLGDQVPGELDGFGLEVIAEGEIAQHFEERVVAAGVADVFQVVVFAARAHAFLRSGGAGVIALFQAQKNLLELIHAGVGEQQRGIVGGHQRTAAHHAMAARGKEVEEALSDVVTCHQPALTAGILRRALATLEIIETYPEDKSCRVFW